ncbi:MAG: carboxypeptidase regulatory-like domain-containing protein [Thermoanaerobaculia bacterium]
MKKWKVTAILAALGVFAIAAAVWAGSQARLTGKVTDSAGNPIEGVAVTVTTPNLGNLKISLKTDKRGQYGTVLNDATMPYDLKFEKGGYVPWQTKKKVPVGDIGIVDAKLLKPSEAGAPAGAAAQAAPSANEQAALAYNAGVDLLQSGDKPGAQAKFLEAVSKNQDLPQAWQALTQLAYETKDWAKTLEYGQKAADLDPSVGAIYAMLAKAAGETGDKKAAAEWEAKYAEANPDTPETLYNKGVEAYNKKNLKEAEGFLAKAVEAKPDFALAHFWLGMTSFTLNKKAAARAHLEKYVELEPNGSEVATAKEMLPLLK